jgi:glycosyltransferase (TIGR04182 family)
MVDRDAVCVLIPTYNERETIGDIVGSFVDQGYEHVLVVDGHSTDGTRDLAREAGARVVMQSGTGQGSGKGQAVREGLREVDRPYVVMLDGDGTYDPEEVDRLLKPLFEGEAEHVIGNRFANMEPGAMTRLNRFGNGIVNRGFARIHGQNLVDILSGYRAFTLESVQRLNLTEVGFGIETEMSVECVKHGVRTTVVPITYSERPDGSETNLDPFRDGSVILLTMYRMAKTSNPLFYFGSVGVTSFVLGMLTAAYVAYEAFVKNIDHEVIALVSAFFLLLGVQLLIFGVLSDMIISLHREQLDRVDRLAGQLGVESGPSAFDAGEDVAVDQTGESTVDGADEEGVAASVDGSND